MELKMYRIMNYKIQYIDIIISEIMNIYSWIVIMFKF